MLNIFDTIRSYAGNWTVVNSRQFTDAEVNAVSSAVVKDSQYGLSVCFFMKNNTQKFIPLSQDSTLKAGETVNVSKAVLLQLSKPGETDIYRVQI